MNVEIENCGHTYQPCAICGERAYKYITNGRASHRFVCDNSICIVTTLLLIESIYEGEDRDIVGEIREKRGVESVKQDIPNCLQAIKNDGAKDGDFEMEYNEDGTPCGVSIGGYQPVPKEE